MGSVGRFSESACRRDFTPSRKERNSKAYFYHPLAAFVRVWERHEKSGGINGTGLERSACNANGFVFGRCAPISAPTGRPSATAPFIPISSSLFFLGSTLAQPFDCAQGKRVVENFLLSVACLCEPLSPPRLIFRLFHSFRAVPWFALFALLALRVIREPGPSDIFRVFCVFRSCSSTPPAFRFRGCFA